MLAVEKSAPNAPMEPANEEKRAVPVGVRKEKRNASLSFCATAQSGNRPMRRIKLFLMVFIRFLFIVLAL